MFTLLVQPSTVTLGTATICPEVENTNDFCYFVLKVKGKLNYFKLRAEITGQRKLEPGVLRTVSITDLACSLSRGKA